MCSFEIEIIFVNHSLKLDLYFAHIKRCFEQIGSIYKIEPVWHFTNKMLFAPTSYEKMFYRDKRLIQFWLYLYPMLLFLRTPFKVIFSCV